MTKKEVLGVFDKFTGLKSANMNERAYSTNQEFYKNQSVDSKPKNIPDRSKSQMAGVSGRFNQSSDPSNLKTLMFVS